MMRFSQMRLSSSNAGAVYYHGSRIFFENCIFTNNYTSQNGGHIFLYYIATNPKYEEFELLFETSFTFTNNIFEISDSKFLSKNTFFITGTDGIKFDFADNSNNFQNIDSFDNFHVFYLYFS